MPRRVFLAFVVCLIWQLPASAADAVSRIEYRELQSAQFSGNKVGISPLRKIAVYLPPGYDRSSQRFPVVYFLNSFDENEKAPFDHTDAQRVFDAATEKKVIPGVIVVTADFRTPMGTSWFVNSPVTGNWQTFMTGELVPYIDRNYRTLPNASSRGIAGDRMGAHGAIRFGMTHPDVFGSVYALHPVGTGNGVQTLGSRPNWDVLQTATTADAVKNDHMSRIFLSIFQAHLPDPDKPPFFVDLPAHRSNGKLVIDAPEMSRLMQSFPLDQMLLRHADDLKKLRGLKIDWGRNDANFDHVYSNRAFAHKLEEFGIPYEAEEFRGGWEEGRNWGPVGRVMTDMLPFFARHLDFTGVNKMDRKS
jgi:enterochelin esterase-like enzyme